MPRSAPARPIIACHGAGRIPLGLFALALGACSLQRSAVGVESDSGPGPVDAGAPLDSGPVDSGNCVPERCNGLDEDCDGNVDEDADDCPCERVERAGQSYLFCTDDRDWAGSRLHCQSVGYDLVIIDDVGENTFLTAEANMRGADYYIGLDDRMTEDTFLWLDGRTARTGDVDLLFAPWRNNEPDDVGPGEGQDCVALHLDALWSTVGCDSPRRHICGVLPP